MKNGLLRVSVLLAAGLALVLATSCTIQKSGEGKNENVKIDTPVGGIHVNTDVNPSDTGLAVYPGAKLKPKDDGDHSSANVNIMGGEMFGVKVVALDYVTDDSPQKVADFYRKDMAKYGNVLECKGGGIHEHNHELVCDNNGHNPDELSLGTGVPGRQRIVPIKPSGKGTEFGLVYVQVRGKEGSL
jgi:hypothetical protein